MLIYYNAASFKGLHAEKNFRKNVVLLQNFTNEKETPKVYSTYPY